MGLFLKGLEKLIFLQNYLFFLFRLCPILIVCVCVGPKWHFNMYLGKISSWSYIVLYVSGLYAYYVFDEMPKWHFVVVLDSDEYQTLGITMFLHSQHFLNIGHVFYTLFPKCAWSCLDHASHMHITCTLDAHT